MLPLSVIALVPIAPEKTVAAPERVRSSVPVVTERATSPMAVPSSRSMSTSATVMPAMAMSMSPSVALIGPGALRIIGSLMGFTLIVTLSTSEFVSGSVVVMVRVSGPPLSLLKLRLGLYSRPSRARLMFKRDPLNSTIAPPLTLPLRKVRPVTCERESVPSLTSSLTVTLAESSSLTLIPFGVGLDGEKVKATSSSVVCAIGTVFSGTGLRICTLRTLLSMRAPPVPLLPWSVVLIVSVAMPKKAGFGVKIKPSRVVLIPGISPSTVTEAVLLFVTMAPAPTTLMVPVFTVRVTIQLVPLSSPLSTSVIVMPATLLASTKPL